jgi:hypothetical protein
MEEISESYSVLFEGGADGENELKEWGWYASIFSLAKEDILNIPKVVKMNLREALTFLIFQKQLNEIRDKEFKKSINKRSY